MINAERALELAEYSERLASQAKKWNEMISKHPDAGHVPATPGHDEIAAILRWAAEVMRAEVVAEIKSGGIYNAKLLCPTSFYAIGLPGDSLIIKPELPK